MKCAHRIAQRGHAIALPTLRLLRALETSNIHLHTHIMNRIVGNQNRSEFILDPIEAWKRGRELDKMLKGAQPPIKRQVLRGTHAQFNAWDDARALEVARKLNGG
jgi:hypothetical protein